MQTGRVQDGIWSEELRIRSYDVDFTQCATLEALCRYFLDAAWRHAELLGVGYRALAAQGKLWVLSRLLVQVERYPRWDESGQIRTWPVPARLALAMRHFEIMDTAGLLLAAGVSAWLVLDIRSRRPQRLEKLLAGIGPLLERRALPEDPQKLPLGATHNTALTRVVQYTDVDANGHLNSARCLSWLLDAHAMDFHHTHEPWRVEINYVGEGLAGESLCLSDLEAAPGEHGYAIWRQSGDEVCRARVRWRMRRSEAATSHQKPGDRPDSPAHADAQ